MKAEKSLYDYPATLAWSRNVGAGGFGPTHSVDRRQTKTLCGLRVPSPNENVWFETMGDGGCARCAQIEARLDRIARWGR